MQVVPQQLKGQGRGLVASRPIKAAEQVLAVPESLVLFPPTAAAGEPECTAHGWGQGEGHGDAQGMATGSD